MYEIIVKDRGFAFNTGIGSEYINTGRKVYIDMIPSLIAPCRIKKLNKQVISRQNVINVSETEGTAQLGMCKKGRAVGIESEQKVKAIG